MICQNNNSTNYGYLKQTIASDRDRHPGIDFWTQLLKIGITPGIPVFYEASFILYEGRFSIQIPGSKTSRDPGPVPVLTPGYQVTFF